MKKRPNILTIAGFDPSGGAGLVADVKTFEQFRCQGMAVQTANTIQTENRFESVNWVSEELVLKQLDYLLTEYEFSVVKVGLIPNLSFLKKALDCFGENRPFVIWDPVLSISAGFDLKHDLALLNEVLKQVDLITPNWNEMKRLVVNEDQLQGAEKLAKTTQVLLKGGHHPDAQGKDYWFSAKGMRSFNPKKGNYSEKHGSGCVFSAALAANLANGFYMEKSVLKTKRYMERILASNESKLAYHK